MDHTLLPLNAQVNGQICCQKGHAKIVFCAMKAAAVGANHALKDAICQRMVNLAFRLTMQYRYIWNESSLRMKRQSHESHVSKFVWNNGLALITRKKSLMHSGSSEGSER
jgi:hypothetical protein